MSAKLITGFIIGFIVFMVVIALVGKLFLALAPAIIIGVVTLICYRVWAVSKLEGDDED